MRQGNSDRWATGNEDLGAEVDADLRALATFEKLVDVGGLCATKSLHAIGQSS